MLVLRHEHYEENFTFTCLNNFENDSKKTPKLTRFLSGCLFVYTFFQFLEVDSYLRTKNFTNTCQCARARENHHDCCWSNFTSQVAGPSEDRARNWKKYSRLITFFYQLLPQITTDITWNVSKMCFLHLKVAKSDAQWTEVRALKCWSDENEMKLEVWGQDSTHIRHFKSFRLRSSGDCSASQLIEKQKH